MPITSVTTGTDPQSTVSTLCRAARVRPVAPGGRYDVVDVVRQLVAGDVDEGVHRIAHDNGTSVATMAAVLAHAVEVGAHKAAGWTGHIRDLAKRMGRAEVTVRRAWRALRAAGVIAGAPAAPVQNPESGQYYRPVATYHLQLPWWTSAASWRRSKAPPATLAPSALTGALSRLSVAVVPIHPTLDACEPTGARYTGPVDSVREMLRRLRVDRGWPAR